MEGETKEKFAAGIFIVSVIAVLALSIIAFLPVQTSMTGEVIASIEDKETTPKEAKVSCIDSDNGKEHFIKGVLEYCDNNGCLSKEDSCSGKKLIEGYCDSNEKNYEEYECDFDCYEGVCVNLVKEYKYKKGSGGSNGGGSGASSNPSTTVTDISQTYDLGELISESSLEIVKNERVKFIITGQEYTLTMTGNTESDATMITNDGQIFNLNTGSDKNIDLNSDGVSELYIKISLINTISHKVKIMMRTI
jgi:hypothetical protein